MYFFHLTQEGMLLIRATLLLILIDPNFLFAQEYSDGDLIKHAGSVITFYGNAAEKLATAKAGRQLTFLGKMNNSIEAYEKNGLILKTVKTAQAFFPLPARLALEAGFALYENDEKLRDTIAKSQSDTDRWRNEQKFGSKLNHFITSYAAEQDYYSNYRNNGSYKIDDEIDYNKDNASVSGRNFEIIDWSDFANRLARAKARDTLSSGDNYENWDKFMSGGDSSDFTDMLPKAATDPVNQAKDDVDTASLNDDQELTKYRGASYGWDDESGKSVWKVDGKIVDESNEMVREFCANPRMNCPHSITRPEAGQPELAPAPTAESSPATISPENLPSQPTQSAATIPTNATSDTIGGIQSAGGNPVVQSGNSIWHGEGGFQGEEYDNNGINGPSKIVQFHFNNPVEQVKPETQDWDLTNLAPSTKTEVKSTSVTQRTIDSSIPQGSAYGEQSSPLATNQNGSSGDFKSTQNSNTARRTATSGRNTNNNNRSRQAANGAMDPVLQGILQGALQGAVQGFVGGIAGGGAGTRGSSQPATSSGCDPRQVQYDTPFPVSGGGCR